MWVSEVLSVTQDHQQEKAARELSQEYFGHDGHWQLYVVTFACANRALSNALSDFRTEILKEIGLGEK